MQLLKIIILSITIFSTFLSAKVVEGTFKLNTFRDGSKNSFDATITVKYKIESLMGEPVVKATAKYEIGQLIDIDGKSYTKDKFTKEQLSKLKIYDLVISVPFDTTYTKSGYKLYIDISMGAMGKVGEWSFNPPESPDWDKWIYTGYHQYLSKEEAIKAYKGLQRLGYGNDSIHSLAMAKTIKYNVSDLKSNTKKQTLKNIWIDKDTNLMWQDEKYTKKEMDNYVKYYKKHKNIGKTGSWNYAKKYCQTLTLNGFTDWRLATIAELDGIKDKRNNFKNTKKKKFRCIWSSNKGYIFSFNEYDKGNKGKWKNKLNTINFVRCVRDMK